MAKKVKSVEISKKPNSRRWKVILHGLAAVSFVTILTLGVRASKEFAERSALRPSTPVDVQLVNPPGWMNDELRQRIIQVATPVSAKSSLDPDQVKEIAQILAAEPWVKHVNQVRRVYGKSPGDTLEIDCDFRAPVALVQDGGWFWMVDAEGIKLPERFTKEELAKVAIGRGLEKIQLRVVTGVHQLAPQAGEKWTGRDLEAGIELARLFFDKPYMNDVAMIDVSGVDPVNPSTAGAKNEVVLHTRYNTQIRWGSPVQQPGFSVEVGAAQKLATLERLYSEYGRLDAGRPWIEIRYDRVVYPQAESLPSAGTN
jgi:hypothetical protein